MHESSCRLVSYRIVSTIGGISKSRNGLIHPAKVPPPPPPSLPSSLPPRRLYLYLYSLGKAKSSVPSHCQFADRFSQFINFILFYFFLTRNQRKKEGNAVQLAQRDCVKVWCKANHPFHSTVLHLPLFVPSRPVPSLGRRRKIAVRFVSRPFASSSFFLEMTTTTTTTTISFVIYSFLCLFRKMKKGWQGRRKNNR